MAHKFISIWLKNSLTFRILSSDEYLSVSDINGIYLKRIKNIITVLKIWFEEEYSIDYVEKDDIYNYFSFDNGGSVLSNTMENSNNLCNALDYMEKYINTRVIQKNDFLAAVYTDLCISIYNCYMNNVKWFEGKETLILLKMEKLYKLIEEHDYENTRKWEESWLYNKVRFFHIRRLLKDLEEKQNSL